METEATLHKSGVLITIFCLPHPIFQPDNVAQSHFIWHSLDKPSPRWKSPFPFILAGLNPQSSSAFCSCLQWQFSMGCQKKKKAICSLECYSTKKSFDCYSIIIKSLPMLLKEQRLRVTFLTVNLLNLKEIPAPGGPRTLGLPGMSMILSSWLENTQWPNNP